MDIRPFPVVMLELQKAINSNRKVQDYMVANVDAEDGVEERLGKLAAYFNIEMDGFYNIIAVAEVLLKELKKEESVIITLQ